MDGTSIFGTIYAFNIIISNHIDSYYTFKDNFNLIFNIYNFSNVIFKTIIHLIITTRSKFNISFIKVTINRPKAVNTAKTSVQ